MLIGADQAISTIQSYRLCWIGGRYSGGKTSVAYKIAETFLQKGYRLITNNNCIWADDRKNVNLLPDGHLKAVVILDEGGLQFKNSRQIEMIAAYSAKMDVIYMIPSFFPPTRSAQILTVQPVFNFKQAGLPVIVYKWRVKLGSFDEKGFFIWVDPAEIYGIYSRQDPGDLGSEIVNWLIEKTEDFRAFYGRSDQLPEMEVSEVDKIADAAEDMAQAADTMSTVLVRKSNRRRF